MSKLIPAFCGLIMLAAPGLMRAQKVTVEFDESRGFSDFKTFRIVNGQLNSKSPMLNSDLIRKNLEGYIRKHLTERGLTEVESRPDLNVRYSLGAANRREVESYPAGWRGLGTRRVAVRYTEGTLVLDLRDTATRSLVWRGISVEEKREPAKLVERLDEMVKKATEKYPPKKK